MFVWSNAEVNGITRTVIKTHVQEALFQINSIYTMNQKKSQRSSRVHGGISFLNIANDSVFSVL